MPALPKWEDEQTILPLSIIDGLEDDVVGNIIEDTYGRVQIMDGKILRDMPEGQSKATIAFQWFSQYRCCLDLENANYSLGTVGIRFQNGSLLSPDFAVWTHDRLDGVDVASRMMQVAHVPRLVCEIEWLEEILQPRKGVDKIVNYFLNAAYLGLPDDTGVPTAVEEAWLVVGRRAGSLPVPDEVRKSTPTPSFLAQLPLPVVNSVCDMLAQFLLWTAVGLQESLLRFPRRSSLVTTVIISIVREFVQLCSWILFPVLRPRGDPPVDPRQPYLAIFRRIEPLHPIYYHFEPNCLFLPPDFSVLRSGPPVSTNLILSHFYKNR